MRCKLLNIKILTPIWCHSIIFSEVINLKDKIYSGQLRLRLPQSLHKILAEQSEYNGISLNKYIINILSKSIENKGFMLSKRKFNEKLIRIRDKVNDDDLESVIAALQPIDNQVKRLKLLCEEDLKNKKILKLSFEQEKELESKYPVFIDISDLNSPIRLKIPSVKMIFEPKNKNLDTNLEQELKKIENSYKNKITLSIGNIDDIDYNKQIYNSNEMKRSFVFHFLTTDLNELKKNIEDINSTIKFKSEDYIIRYIPTYLYDNIKCEF